MCLSLKESLILVNTGNSFPIQLSPYNYERIEVVLKIIQAADDNVASFSVSQVKKKKKTIQN